MKLWDKGADAENWVTRFTVGEDWRWDTLLLPYDVAGTRAHARALGQVGLLDQSELIALESALDSVLKQVLSGSLSVTQEDEDAHTVIENSLTAQLGKIGEKIHAGRSRNDQVLVALRLFLRERIWSISRDLASLIEQLVRLSHKYAEALLPGYTHMQHAMPSTAGLWAAGYAELLVADLEGLHVAFLAASVSPWGSAAGYGVPHLDLPREYFADELGFTDVQHNVTSVQLSRGKIEASVVHGLAQVSASLNRLASDLVLFNMPEFDFVRIPDSYTTGSSIMPQKKNPDVLELSRATHHRIVAELHLLLSLPANLPSGYHRDLQLTKEAVMRAVTVAGDLVSAVSHVCSGLEFDTELMQASLSPELFATNTALKKVKAGIPFRTAYRETAGELDQVRIPSKEEILGAYRDAGLPGQPDTTSVIARMEKFRNWLSGTEE